MGEIKLYTTGCPRCRMLEEKLDRAGYLYEKITDVNVMAEKGLKEVPALEVNGELMDFLRAAVWVSRKEESHEA